MMSATRNSRTGRLIVISAPSGCGKTTVVSCWLKQRRSLKRSVSYTTRMRRPGERGGKDYYFVGERKFRRLTKRNFFLEWARVFGEWYGTPKHRCFAQVRRGLDLVLAIDVRGARQVRRHCRGRIPLITIFIMPPSLGALKKRLLHRKTDSLREVKKRLLEAAREMRARKEYDRVVVNDRLGACVRRIDRLVYGGR